MHKFLFLFCFIQLSCTSLLAQTTKFKYLNAKEIEKIQTSEQILGEVDCGNADLGPIDPYVIIEVAAVDPETSDVKKEERVRELDSLLAQLQGYADCEEINGIIIHLGEALFIQKTEMAVYSKAYYKKGGKLNAQRFWKRYQSKFEEWLPGKTIILSDWEW